MPRTVDEFSRPTSTVIGAGFTIHAARFACTESESMQIDGTVIGDIDIEGLINISETGRVDGNISAGSARIAGRVFGNLQCKNTLHLTATADVAGDILTGILIVDDGALFVGSCQTHIAPEDEESEGVPKLRCGQMALNMIE